MAVCQVEGKEAPGPLFDFGLLLFHCGKILFENKSGPFFYLSKVTYIHTHSLKHTDDLYNINIVTMKLYCFSLFSRWRASWRPDYGTKYLSGHNRRSVHWSAAGFVSVILPSDGDTDVI